MKVDKINKFWYVMRYQPRTNPQDEITIPRHRHVSREIAEIEALRLAKKFPNANFVILEAVNFITTPPPVYPEPVITEIVEKEWNEEKGDIVNIHMFQESCV